MLNNMGWIWIRNSKRIVAGSWKWINHSGSTTLQGPGTKEDGYLAYYEICNFVLGMGVQKYIAMIQFLAKIRIFFSFKLFTSYYSTCAVEAHMPCLLKRFRIICTIIFKNILFVISVSQLNSKIKINFIPVYQTCLPMCGS